MWCAVLLPIFYWNGPSSMLHDGAHGSLVPYDRERRRRGLFPETSAAAPWNAVANDACACLGSLHCAPLTWRVQHVVSHHAHTNRVGRDPDLYHFSHLAPAYLSPGSTTFG